MDGTLYVACIWLVWGGRVRLGDLGVDFDFEVDG
jgi:hypothetical protein